MLVNAVCPVSVLCSRPLLCPSLLVWPLCGRVRVRGGETVHKSLETNAEIAEWGKREKVPDVKPALKNLVSLARS